jgi:transcriptional regulator with XRE-family HTH domain
MNFFGKNLRFLIKKLALSQASIESVVDKRQTTISNWINEKSSPDAEDLVKLSQYFGIPIDDLCLIDLSNGNLITEEYLRKFRHNGNQKGNLIGNPMTYFYQKTGMSRGTKEELEEAEEGAIWLILHVVRQMDIKLDLIRDWIKHQDKKGGSK